MTTPISTTLNLNLASATPRSAEATKTDNPSEKPLSPETQQALQRWYNVEFDGYTLYPQANQSKLTYFLQHPVKNITNFSSLLGTAIMGSMGLVAFFMASNAKHLTPQKLKEFKSVGYVSLIATPLFAGLGLWQFLRIKSLNKDTLQGIQTLGENATRQEWLNYKKQHPELKQA